MELPRYRAETLRAVEYFLPKKNVLADLRELMHAKLCTSAHTQSRTCGAHTMGAALQSQKMKRGTGLGSPTLSISPSLGLTECSAEAR